MAAHDDARRGGGQRPPPGSAASDDPDGARRGGSQPPPPGPGAGEDPDDAAALAGYAATLADAAARALPGWVERSIRRVLAAQGITPDRSVEAAIDDATATAAAEGGRRLRELLATDIDRQAGTPLAVVRSLVRHPTAVLRSAGARPVARDEFAARSFPDDVYDLSPASFADVDPALAEPALVWGAAKAHVHLARRRREGRRPPRAGDPPLPP